MNLGRNTKPWILWLVFDGACLWSWGGYCGERLASEWMSGCTVNAVHGPGIWPSTQRKDRRKRDSHVYRHVSELEDDATREKVRRKENLADEDETQSRLN